MCDCVCVLEQERERMRGKENGEKKANVTKC